MAFQISEHVVSGEQCRAERTFDTRRAIALRLITYPGQVIGHYVDGIRTLVRSDYHPSFAACSQTEATHPTQPQLPSHPRYSFCTPLVTACPVSVCTTYAYDSWLAGL